MRANWLFQVNLFDIFFRCLKMRDSHNSYQKDGIFFSRKALEYCFFFGGEGRITSLFFLHQHHFFSVDFQKSCSTYCLDFIPRGLRVTLRSSTPNLPGNGWESREQMKSSQVGPRQYTPSKPDVEANKSLNPFWNRQFFQKKQIQIGYLVAKTSTCVTFNSIQRTHDIPNKN